jgi:hypothetical protein
MKKKKIVKKIVMAGVMFLQLITGAEALPGAPAAPLIAYQVPVGQDDIAAGNPNVQDLTFAPGYGKTSFTKEMFRGLRSLRRITIPREVVFIETGCFSECRELEEVIFEAGSRLQRIDIGAFNGCPLESITIPASVILLETSCFQRCTALRDVIFENGSNIREINAHAFYGCSSLEKIAIPGVVTLGSGSFRRCENLKEVKFEREYRLKHVCADAFDHCHSLTRIEIPNGSDPGIFGELAAICVFYP